MSDKNGNYVLAMYDIRAKQEFIFKCNRIKEIAGASKLMEKCYEEYLYPVAMKDGKGIYQKKNPHVIEAFKAEYREQYGEEIEENAENYETLLTEYVAFSEKKFIEHIEAGYVGEVVYEGGGNFLLLFENEEKFKEITYAFTKEVLKNIGTMKVLGTCIPIENFGDYPSDRKALQIAHTIHEHQESNSMPWGTLPIVRRDRRTYLPIVKEDETYSYLSKESVAKYEFYGNKKYYDASEWKIMQDGALYLDSLVQKKGEDSLLAVVYIDGNSMGAKVQNCIEGAKSTSYDDCISELRKFSDEIKTYYVDDAIQAIDAKLAELHPEKKETRRLVVGAGDEINFICNAHDALACAKAYVESLSAHENHSACVGIAIFHSHAPYSEVYRIAEECCESGKKVMRKYGISNASFVDFHYCQGAIGVSLEEIRQSEGTEHSSRPWLMQSDKETQQILEKQDNSCISYNLVEKTSLVLHAIGRSNVKDLMEAYKKGDLQYKLEVERVCAHMKKEKIQKLKEQMNAMGEDAFTFISYVLKNRKLIYDMAIVYDVWFKKGEVTENGTDNE